MISAFRRYFNPTEVWGTGSVSACRTILHLRANGSNAPRGRLGFAVFSTAWIFCPLRTQDTAVRIAEFPNRSRGYLIVFSLFSLEQMNILPSLEKSPRSCPHLPVLLFYLYHLLFFIFIKILFKHFYSKGFPMSRIYSLDIFFNKPFPVMIIFF